MFFIQMCLCTFRFFCNTFKCFRSFLCTKLNAISAESPHRPSNPAECMNNLPLAPAWPLCSSCCHSVSSSGPAWRLLAWKEEQHWVPPAASEQNTTDFAGMEYFRGRDNRCRSVCEWNYLSDTEKNCHTICLSLFFPFLNDDRKPLPKGKIKATHA